MPVKKTSSVKRQASSKKSGLSVPVYSLVGKESGSLELPKAVFGQEVNRSLLAQATRVYLNNQKGHHSHTKTRSEVQGSTRKIYKQKGTGGARHGSIRAPIFVGGGIALGPKSRKVVLELPQKMRQAALLSALSLRASEGQVVGMSGLEKAKGKTAEVVKLVKSINKPSTLFVLADKNEMLQRAVNNLGSVNVAQTNNLNSLQVLSHQTLVVTKEAVEKLGGTKE